MLKTILGWLRLVGTIEAISLLVLLGIAMPLKYFADMPMAVKVVGMTHGVLWVIYVAVILLAWRAFQWSWTRLIGGLVASVLPFGPFVFDAYLPKEEPAKSESV